MPYTHTHTDYSVFMFLTTSVVTIQLKVKALYKIRKVGTNDDHCLKYQAAVLLVFIRIVQIEVLNTFQVLHRSNGKMF